MELDTILDFPEFRKHLQEMKAAFQEGMAQEPDYPSELKDLVAAMGRLDKELSDQKAQQLIADFLMVSSFVQSLGEDSEEDIDFDEFDEDEFETFEEDDED
jgi:hypothetical protein